MDMNEKFRLLQLFAEGADTGATPAAAVPDNTGEKGAPVAGVQEEDGASDAEFEALIKGRFKQAYDKRVQDTISRRLKNAKEAEQRYQTVLPLLETLGKRYGVEALDIEGLTAAVRGTEQAAHDGAGKLYDAWLQQEQQTRKLYPAFSMGESLRDPRFRALLRGGADVRTAYEAVNVQRIIPAAMAVAAKMAQQQVARSIASTAGRPDESAMGGRAAAAVKADVSKFTKAQVDAVSRRVAQGERVSFG